MAAMQNYAMLNGGVGLIPGQVPVIPPIPGAPGIQLPVTAMPPLPTVAAPLPPPVPVAVMPPLPTAPLPPAQPQVDVSKIATSAPDFKQVGTLTPGELRPGSRLSIMAILGSPLPNSPLISRMPLAVPRNTLWNKASKWS
uniref:Uncharacterized protein n=1 Tax=Lygus hesperus TaxID=30085 RepID=A0A0A9X524_LYGHE